METKNIAAWGQCIWRNVVSAYRTITKRIDAHIEGHPRLARARFWLKIWSPLPWRVDLSRAANWVRLYYQPGRNFKELEYELRMLDQPFGSKRQATMARYEPLVLRPSIWRLALFVKGIQKDHHFWEKTPYPAKVDIPRFTPLDMSFFHDDTTISSYNRSPRQPAGKIPDDKFFPLIEKAQYDKIMLRRAQVREDAKALVEQWNLDQPDAEKILTTMDDKIDKLRQDRDDLRGMFYLGPEEPMRKR